jgi:glycosyltransferase involved in cell wall biosynthesis
MTWMITCWNLQHADLIRVYSETLQRYLLPYNSNVVRVDGPLDWSLVPEKMPARDHSHVRIVYATSRFEDQIGLMLVDEMRQVLDKFPQAEFVVWGPRFKPLVEHPQVSHIPPIFDYDMFLYSFARRGFDIGLAPLPDDLFHRCKSNNKFREYGACAIAGIYSDTDVYRDSVIDGVTGLLVGERKGAWFEAVARLIEDEPLREYIQKKARTYTRKHYSMEKMQADWMAQIEQVLLQKRFEPAVSTRTAKLEQSAPRGDAFSGRLLFVVVTGILAQIIHFGRKIGSSVRQRDFHVTMSKLKVHLSSIYQLIMLKIGLWRSPFRR